MKAEQILDREFLGMRAKILEVAASMDRMDRADGSVDSDPRVALISQAVDILSSSEPKKAERLQMLFSREYDENWKQTFWN